jgi:hypothetical protein
MHTCEGFEKLSLIFENLQNLKKWERCFDWHISCLKKLLQIYAVSHYRVSGVQFYLENLLQISLWVMDELSQSKYVVRLYTYQSEDHVGVY